MLPKKVSNAMHCGLAATLAITMALPTQALAQEEDPSPDLLAQDAGESGDASVVDAVQQSSHAVVDATSVGEEDAASASDGASQEDGVPALSDEGDGNVTIIVQLEEAENQGFSLFSFLFDNSDESRHSRFKDEIRELASAVETAPAAEESEESDSDERTQNGGEGMALLSAKTDASSSSGDGEVQELHDYYNVIDGFAVKAPASILDDIKALSGVKNAFIETVYEVPTDQESTGTTTLDVAELKNQNALDATGADETGFTGKGQTVAIIDTGLDTDHEAFGGDVPDSTLALTSSGVDGLRGSLKGSGAQYISEKIPFAYDYADGDSDVNPGVSGLEHGTHVAGIAAANGGDQIRGTAPDAQILAMKVASDSDRGLYDSAILAALDDCALLLPDSINVSLGRDAGFGDGGEATYADAIGTLEDAGVTVNVAAGNSYSYGYNNQSGENKPYAEDPDNSVVSTPASVSSSLAVASVGSDPLEVADGGDEGSYITTSDGTKMQYWEAKGPDGEVRAKKFADLVDGDYDVVWGDVMKITGSLHCGELEIDGDTYGPVAGQLEGKILLVEGHGDPTGMSVISYARALSDASDLGAEAVVFYDTSLTQEQIEAAQIAGGIDEGNYSDSYYDANDCPAIFVTAEAGEALKDQAASERTVTKAASQASATGVDVVAADGTQVAYATVTGPDGSPTVNKFSELAEGDYEYVYCGIARSSGDYDGEDYDGDIDGDWSKLNGKVAIVKGNGWFLYESNIYGYSKMVQQCTQAGAVAVIIVDDRYSEPTSVSFENDDCWAGTYGPGGTEFAPTILVGYEQGQALIGAGAKTVTVSRNADEPETTAYYQMSSYSSWGVTPDLKLKPEVAAPGGNVYSSIPNGGYAYYSGTSMATPQLAGIAAQVTEYVESSDKFSGMADDAKQDLVTQLLMSTASPMADTDDLSSYYSPRHQGAGLVDVPAATTTDVYATVDSATNESRPKADLGESGEGSWTFSITLHNAGDAEQTFDFDAAALSDTVANGLFQLQSKNWTGQGIDVSADCGDQVTIPADGDKTVTVTVTCDSAFTGWAAANTPNGTFVDGFAFFRAADGSNGGVDLSVSFMGFYGDWSDADVLDKDVDEAYHSYGSSLVDGSTGEYLGVNPLDDSAASDASKVDMDKVVISNSSYAYAPNAVATKTGLLRNADKLTYEIIYKDLVIDDDGTVGDVSGGTLSYDYVPKTFWNDNAGAWVYAEALIGGSPSVEATGADMSFDFTETATTSGPTPETQTVTHTVTMDNTAPEITDVAYSEAGTNGEGEPTLTFTVEDNTYLSAIDFVDPEITGVTPYLSFKRVLVDPDEALVGTAEDGRNVYEVTVKVSDIKGAWSGDATIPNVVHAYAWDYGMNPSGSSDAVINPVAATEVSIDAESVDVAPGQETLLEATLTPADTTETKLEWSIDDESVATIDKNGALVGIAEGSATVTGRVADRPDVTDSIEVTVANVGDGEGIRMSAASKRVISEGGTVEVSALLSDAYQGASVAWSSSDEGSVTVKANPSDSSRAVITGDYQVSDATVTATVTASDGTAKTATMAAQNRTEDYDDYVIDENGLLTKYVGVKTSIKIPNDVTGLADKLLYGNVPVTEVFVPASVTHIGEEAFAKHVVRTSTSYSATGSSKAITFEDTEEHPSQLAEIGDRAFAEGGAKGTLTMPDSVTKVGEGLFEGNLAINYVRLSDNLTEIPDNTFLTCASLMRVAMSDDVTRIGNSVFKSCLYLENIEIIGRDAEEGVIPLPSKLVEIGDSAFAAGYIGGWIDEDGNTRGAKVTIPEGVKRIESSAFALNTYIIEVELNDGLEEIGQNAFLQTMVYSLTLPDSVTKLDWHAFFGMVNLQELTLSKNLGDGELSGTVGSYQNLMSGHTSMSLEKVNVPSDALYYTEQDGAVFNKDMTELAYYPAALVGDDGVYSIPEGVTTIAEGAFDDSHLTNIVFPASLETVEFAGVSKQLETIDWGENIIEVQQNAFKQVFYSDESGNKGYTPNHLIVRGGQNGSYSDTQNAQNQQTAYFGPGMTSLDFSLSGAPGTLVVPADLESLNLSGNAGNQGAVTVYAPEGSEGWSVAKSALEAIGADPATQLKPYVQLVAKAEVETSQTGVKTVAASSEGGVGGVWYRFVQVNQDATENVLQDWSSTSTCALGGDVDAAVRVEVRDATELTASTMAIGPAAPTITANLSTEAIKVAVGSEIDPLVVGAHAEDGAELSHQWYCDGTVIEGATQASFTPPTDVESTHTYYCVVAAAKDGLTTSVKSNAVTVMVGTAAIMPTITKDLSPQVSVQAAENHLLEIAAVAEDGGTLSYQWYRDGKVIQGATGTTYQVDTTELGTHLYQVTVTNTLVKDGSTTTAVAQSTVCRVTVTEIPKPVGDASTLRTYVDRVDGLTEANYAPETWASFATALKNAQAVLGKAGVVQPDLNAALSDLQLAYRALVSTQQNVAVIPDGSYDMAVSMGSALDIGAGSMAGSLLNEAATLAVKEGAYSLTLQLDQHATVMGLDATIRDLYYYPQGYTVAEDGSVSGVGTPTAVPVDAADAENLPVKVTVPLNDQAKTEGSMLMSGTFEGMGTMKFMVKVDWNAFTEETGIATPSAVDKVALNEALAQAKAVSQNGSVIAWKVLQLAVSSAQKAADDLYAVQSEVDAQAIALAEASDRAKSLSGFPFLTGGVYQMPATTVDANGSQLNPGFTLDAQAVSHANGYDVALTASLEPGVHIEKLIYGDEEIVAEEVQQTGLAAREAASAAQHFKVSVNSLTEPVKVVYEARVGDALPTTQSGYLLFDTAAVDIVDESGVSLVDKSGLGGLIAEASAVRQGAKSDAAFEELQQAISDAEDVFDNADATQTDVAIAAKKLQEAMEAFEASEDVKPTPADTDRTALTDLVAAASGIQQGAKGDAAFEALQAAIAQARTTLDDADATQDQVDAAVSALQAAVQAFEASEDATSPNPGDGDDADTGNGSGTGGNSSNDVSGSNGSDNAGSGERTLVRTGDDTPAAAVGITSMLAGAAAAVAFARRKRGNGGAVD